MMHDTLAWAEIDLSAIKHNFDLVQQSLTPQQKNMAVIKADAYGHGAVEIAKAISPDAFAVARLSEALELRNAQIDKRILLMSEWITPELLQECQRHQLEPVIHSRQGVEALEAIQPANKPLYVWFKYNSGMHRLGLDEDSLLHARNIIESREDLIFEGIMTHLASAEEIGNPKNTEQADKFSAIYERMPQVSLSLANSAAVMFHPKLQSDWFRLGIMLYGVNPAAAENPMSKSLKPAMTVKARVIDVKDVPVGETVGYNQTWKATTNSRIAVIGLGYADGYPRHARAGTPIVINDQTFPLAGRVSMDMITVDVTGANTPVETGDIATIWGRHPSAKMVASFADTIAYELFTNLGQRVERRFIR